MRINQINLNGVNLVCDDWVFATDGLFNIEKEITTNEVYSNGSSYNKSKLRSKKFVLNGILKTNSFAKIAELNKIFIANSLKKIIFSIVGVGELYGYVEIENSIRPIGSRKISMQLVMPDPYLYSNETMLLVLGAVSNNGITFPMTFPIQFGSITGGQGSVTNDGNVESYPVINVTGTCSNISIENITTGESMNCNISLLENDILIIDCRPNNRGIYLNGAKRMDLKDGQWIKCLPGYNEFVFTRNSLETKQHCTIELQSRWV